MEPKDLKGKAIQNCPGLGALHMIEMIQYISSQTSYVLTSSYIILHLTSTKWLSHICTARQQRSLRVSRGKTEQVSLKTQDDPSRDSLKQVKRTVETLDASGIVPSAGPGPLDSLLALLLQPRRTLWLWWTLLDIFSGDPGILTISWWWITIRNGTPLLINQGASMNLGST